MEDYPVKKCCYALMLFTLLCAPEALASRPDGERDCAYFTVAFDKPVERVPKLVIAGKKNVGVIQAVAHDGARELVICVDRKYAPSIESDAICYVDGDNLLLYNVWTSGQILPEGGTLRGFAGKMDMHIHEAKTLLKAASSFLASWLSRLFPGLAGKNVE
jgi:hypothetical protein